MSKRFGRNQRRLLRHTEAALVSARKQNTALGWAEREALKRAQGAEATLERLRHTIETVLHRNSLLGFVARDGKADGKPLHFPDGRRIYKDIPQRARDGQHAVLRVTDLAPLIVKHRDLFDGDVVFEATHGEDRRACIAMTTDALRDMPRDLLVKELSTQIARTFDQLGVQDAV